MPDEGVLEPTGSETPVEPTSAVEGTTPAPVETTPVATTPTQATPEPEPTFRLPGQPTTPADNEAEWLRQEYARALNERAQLRQKLEEFELAGLEGPELEIEQLRRQNEAVQQQMQQWQQQQAVSEWRNYWSQFSTPQEIAHIQDPVQMGHQVVTKLYGELAAARKELAALKAVVKPAPGPQVTTGGSGNVVNKSISNMTAEERERMRRTIQMTGRFPSI